MELPGSSMGVCRLETKLWNELHGIVGARMTKSNEGFIAVELKGSSKAGLEK